MSKYGIIINRIDPGAEPTFVRAFGVDEMPNAGKHAEAVVERFLDKPGRYLVVGVELKEVSNLFTTWSWVVTVPKHPECLWDFT